MHKPQPVPGKVAYNNARIVSEGTRQISTFFGPRHSLYYNRYQTTLRDPLPKFKTMPRVYVTGTKRPNPYSNMPRNTKQRTMIVPRPPTPTYSTFKRPQPTNSAVDTPELKSTDSAFLVMIPGPIGAPAEYVINDIDQGSGPFQRIGRKIFLKSYKITGSLQFNPGLGAGTVPDQIVRMNIIYDRQPNGLVPAWGDVFAGYDKLGAVTTTTYQNTNPNNRDRFTIFEDRVIYLPQIVSGAGGVQTPGTDIAWGGGMGGIVGGPSKMDQALSIQEYRKVNLETTYKGTASAAANGATDIATGSLFVWFTNSGAGTCPIQFQGHIRINFTD